MAEGRYATILRLGKPIVAGLALAYLVTAFVDKPAPVHFQPGNPYAAQQSAIVEPETALVAEKNIMKLGSPLSVLPDKGVPDANPLAVLEEVVPPAEVNATAAEPAPVARGEDAVEAAPEATPAVPEATPAAPAVPAETAVPGDAVPAVRGEVDTILIPAPAAP